MNSRLRNGMVFAALAFMTAAFAGPASAGSFTAPRVSVVPGGVVTFRIPGSADEKPVVRTMFAEALAANGLQSNMDAAYEAELAKLPAKVA